MCEAATLQLQTTAPSLGLLQHHGNRIRGRFLGVIVIATCCTVVSLRDGQAQVYSNDFEPGPGVTWRFGPGVPIEAAGQNLEGSLFGAVSLRNAKFDRANLREVTFAQIYFPHDVASFRESDLRNATWDGFRYEALQQCDFTDARIEGMSCTRSMNLAPEQFLTAGQIQSTMSYKIKNLSGLQIWAGYRRTADGQPLPSSQNWTQRSPSSFVKKMSLDLRGFDLRGTRFYYGDFTESDFTDSYIRGAEFRGSLISYDQIASTKSWQGVYLDSANLDTPLHIVLSGTDCTGWDFSGRKLRGSTFSNANLVEADFRGADLRSTVFTSCDAHGADFSGADLRGAFLSGKSGDGADFADADVREFSIPSSFSPQQFYKTASYHSGDLSGITLRGMAAAGLDLSRQILAGAIFIRCDFAHVDLTDAIITNVEFRCSKANHRPSAEQLKSTWNYKHGRLDGIVCFTWDPATRELVRDEQWPRSVLEDTPSTTPGSPGE